MTPALSKEIQKWCSLSRRLLRRASGKKHVSRTFKSKHLKRVNSHSHARTVDTSMFQGQIGVSNEERHHVRKIKLDDLRATIEKQMHEKHHGRAVEQILNQRSGARAVEEDQSQERMVGPPVLTVV